MPDVLILGAAIAGVELSRDDFNIVDSDQIFAILGLNEHDVRRFESRFMAFKARVCGIHALSHQHPWRKAESFLA